MRKLSVLTLGVIAVFAMSTLASAATGGNGDGRPPLPAGAVQVSENVYYLGKKKVDGVELEGYAHVLRAKEHASQSGANAAGRKPPKACYSLIGFPAWATPEDWKVNTDGAPPSVSPTMLSGIDTAIGAWEQRRRYEYLRLWVDRHHRPPQLVSGRAERRAVRQRWRWRHCRCHLHMGIETSRDLRVGHDLRQ